MSTCSDYAKVCDTGGAWGGGKGEGSPAQQSLHVVSARHT